MSDFADSNNPASSHSPPSVPTLHSHEASALFIVTGAKSDSCPLDSVGPFQPTILDQVESYSIIVYVRKTDRKKKKKGNNLAIIWNKAN